MADHCSDYAERKSFLSTRRFYWILINKKQLGVEQYVCVTWLEFVLISESRIFDVLEE